MPTVRAFHQPRRYPPECFDRALDRFRPEGGIDTNAVLVFCSRGEYVTRSNADPLPQRFLVKPERIDLFRHFHPENESPLGARHPRPFGKVATDGIADLTDLRRIDSANGAK